MDEPDAAPRDRRMVLRGDKLIPIDKRFDLLERRVNLLLVLVIIELLISHSSDLATIVSVLKGLGL